MEPVFFLQIDQPFCTKSYGVGTCPAVLGVDSVRKCFNTRATCPVPDSYLPTLGSIPVDSVDFAAADSFNRGANLTGISSTKSGIVSAWIRFDGSDNQEQILLYGSDPPTFSTVGMVFYRESDNRIHVQDNTGVGTSFSLSSLAQYLAGPTWLHILAAWNGATGAKHLYVNDVSDLDPASASNNVNTNYASCTDWLVGGVVGFPSYLDGCMAELYFAPGQYLDLSVTANRRKFIDADGYPADLGATGATPTGTAPRVYLGISFGAAVDDFLTNRGTGGDFRAITDSALQPGSDSPTPANPITLTFSRPQEGLLGFDNVTPSVQSWSLSPASVNLGGLDKNASALGQRESLTVKFDDHLCSDLIVDPYRLERPSGTAGTVYDPFTSGTFWGKFAARNPYSQHYACRAYIGDLTEDGTLDDMPVNHYVIDKLDGPSNGTVTLTAKDLFSLIQQQKAVAPTASRGQLAGDISAVAASGTLSPSGIGNVDYQTSGYLSIGDEEILFTRSGDTLTFVTRGANGSIAAAHEQQDTVQEVLVYASELAHDIVYDLLTSFSSVSAGAIDLDDWDLQAVELTQVYSTHIVRPTPVESLIGELAEESGFTCWPDVTSGMIKFVPLRAQSGTVLVDDDAWIVDGSLKTRRRSDLRVSQVWVYYGQIDATKELDERRNYRSRVVIDDVDAENDNQYGTPTVREIFSRWIPQFGRQAALNVGNRILAMFRDPPLEATFNVVSSRADSFGLARYFTIRTADIQDDMGAALDTLMAAVEIEAGEDEITVRSQEVRFFTADGDTGERVIYIENNSSNLNLRTVHDLLYTPPLGGSPGEVVRFIVIDGVFVGSSTTAQYAIDTGTWPSGVQLYLDNAGRIEGRGGDAGAGGTSFGGGAVAGGAGSAGGPALRAQYPITVDNTGGEIWAGGGGGGGGGAVWDPGNQRVGGGGAGGGAGNSPGAAAAGGAATGGGLLRPGNPGTPGTTETAGSGAAGGVVSGSYHGGAGGNGGGPGLAGSAGSAADISGGTAGATVASSPGAAGAAGNYITGNGFVTWAVAGDRRGGVA